MKMGKKNQYIQFYFIFIEAMMEIKIGYFLIKIMSKDLRNIYLKNIMEKLKFQKKNSDLLEVVI